MRGSRITGLVSNTVTLGGQAYPSPLTVSSTGTVAPTSPGADAVFSSVAGVVLHNHGLLIGGNASATATNGAGVDFTAFGTVTNSGTISCGSQVQRGATYGAAVYLHGGGVVGNAGVISGGYNRAIGVDILGGGQLSNSGTVVGGFGSGYVFEGAAAVYSQGAAIRNSGLLQGGHSYAGNSLGGGTGGVGVDLRGGSLSNSGTILGGNSLAAFYGGGPGGVGIDVTANATISNRGTIMGGAGAGADDGGKGPGGNGIDITASATINNSGLIAGGLTGAYASFDNRLVAASGIAGNAASIVNSGNITGASAGTSQPTQSAEPRTDRSESGEAGGAGISLVTATIVNRGDISGGNANSGVGQLSIGGDGIELSGAGTVTNQGMIIGGSSGGLVPSGSQSAATGGNGIDLQAGGVVTNGGFILGNTGGTGYDDGTGGNGGAGILLEAAGIIVNTGAITGGSGGISYNGNGGNGGTGVSLDGGTLTTTGTIAGGAGGAGPAADGKQGDAVQFGALASTLIIDAGAVFHGVVAANDAVDDTLRLIGPEAGTLSGLGSIFTGFSTVVESAGATWLLSGSNTLSATSDLEDRGALAIGGSLLDAGFADVSDGGTFAVSSAAAAQVATLDLSGGAITLASTAELVVGAELNGAAPGDILIQAGATLAGFGIAGDAAAAGIIDNGNIEALGGTLTLADGVTGAGTATIGVGATLSITDSFGAAAIAFNAGPGQTLIVADRVNIAATLTGFGKHDVIDEKQAITSVIYTAGTLTLLDQQTAVGALLLAGNYNADDFHVTPDGRGGTDITYAANDFGLAVDGPAWGGYAPSVEPSLAWSPNHEAAEGVAAWWMHAVQWLR